MEKANVLMEDGGGGETTVRDSTRFLPQVLQGAEERKQWAEHKAFLIDHWANSTPSLTQVLMQRSNRLSPVPDQLGLLFLD